MENWTHARAVAFQSYAQRTITALGTVDAGAVAEAAWHMHREQRMCAHVFVIGNGGSFSTAEHIAADLSRSGGVKGVRGPGYLDWITGQANDFGYESIFQAYLMMCATPGDVLIALSVSKQSPNIILACQYWQERGDVIGLWGRRWPQGADKFADVSIFVDDDDPKVVETCHLAIGQAWADMVSA